MQVRASGTRLATLTLIAVTCVSLRAFAAAPTGSPPPVFNPRTGLLLPPLLQLVSAYQNGDRAELARLAARIGVARIAAALRDGAKDSGSAGVRAALDSVTLIAGGARLLETVTPLVDHPDAAVASHAVRVLGLLLDATEPARLGDWEVPPDAVRSACMSLALGAMQAAPAADLRLAAILAVGRAGAACASQPPPWLLLLRDGDPIIRRAAVLVLPIGAAVPVSALRERLADADPDVASAAGVAWCRRRLADAALAKQIRSVALADGTPVEDVAEISPCLAASGDPADKKALQQIQKSHPAAW